MADLFRLSASEATARIREGKLTSEALVRSCLERIDSRESQVKACVHLNDDFALASSRRISLAKGSRRRGQFWVKSCILVCPDELLS